MEKKQPMELNRKIVADSGRELLVDVSDNGIIREENMRFINECLVKK